jgi:hypothetical protein
MIYLLTPHLIYLIPSVVSAHPYAVGGGISGELLLANNFPEILKRHDHDHHDSVKSTPSCNHQSQDWEQLDK